MNISIITICYNSKTTIKDTIESVLSQKNCDIEYIIIDGLSTDGTIDIIHEYAEKNKNIKYIIEKDMGIYDAMNKGVKIATSDVIGILNSDDVYADQYVISDVLDFFESNKVDSCFGNLVYIRENKTYRYWRAGPYRSFRSGWMPPHPAFFVKKEVYIKYGLFRLDIGTSADYEIMLRFLYKEKISTLWINRLCTIMRVGGASNNGIKSRIKALKFDKIAWDLNCLSMPLYTLLLKKLLKIPQYIFAFFIHH